MTALDPDYRYEVRFRAIEDRLQAIERDLAVIKTRLDAIPSWRWMLASVITVIAVNAAVCAAYFASISLALNQIASRLPSG